VLPAIPDVEYGPTGILLTDVELREWQDSNPIGCPDDLSVAALGQAYASEHDLYTARHPKCAQLHDRIHREARRQVVGFNTAHEDGNFADKWDDYPERRTAFIARHRDITALLDELVRCVASFEHEESHLDH
jgi:hypothetical protein